MQNAIYIYGSSVHGSCDVNRKDGRRESMRAREARNNDNIWREHLYHRILDVQCYQQDTFSNR